VTRAIVEFPHFEALRVVANLEKEPPGIGCNSLLSLEQRTPAQGGYSTAYFFIEHREQL